MQKITAELLGSGRILLDGKPVNLPFKQAEALVYYLLVEKETFRPKLADIIWGDSADEHKVQSNMRNAIYVIRREFGRDFLVGVILSRLVDTFFSRISLTMPLPPKFHNTAYVLLWEEDLHWQSRSSGCSSS